MNLIVDASVGVKWFAEEDRSVEARRLVTETIAAPDFVLIEIFNALTKRARRGALPGIRLTEVLPVIERAIDLLVPCRELVGVAARLSASFDHPIYDCLYLALAEREGAPLVTADERQFAAARKARIEARLL